MNNVVKLVFQSAVSGSGFDDFLRKTEASIANSDQLGQSLSAMSSKLGAVGASIGGVVGNLVKGSVWGAATAAVMGVVEAVRKWRAEAALAAEANSRAFAEVQQKATAAAEQMKGAYQKSIELIDAAAKKKKEDIELTNRQTKAEIELAAAKARAAGRDREAAALEAKAGAADARANEQAAAIDVQAAQRKLDAAKKQAAHLPGWKNNGQDFEFDPRDWERERRRRNGRMDRLRLQLRDAEEQNRKAVVDAASPAVAQQGRIRMADVGRLRKDLEDEAAARNKFIENMKAARQAAANVADAERVLTQARKAERIAIAGNQKTTVVAMAAAARASKDEQLAALRQRQQSQDAKRQAQGSEASRWQGEFNAAFDLWRDPEAARQAVEADRRRADDMKAYRKAVRRYSGQGRIDEYARLMREGDEEGMQSRIAEWRRNSRFTPQVEQMVKAAAAEQNRNAAERSLANIEKNTQDLASKIDELLRLK